MKKMIFSICLLLSLSGFCQDRLLTKKIIYTISVTDNKVKSSSSGDSIVYDYNVNRRFWWEAMDYILGEAKNKRLTLYSDKGDAIVWDTMLNNLSKQIKNAYGKELKKKEIEAIFENEIRKIQFEEEWTYNSSSMLIDKKVIAYCPIISRDSVALVGEEITTQESFSFPIGWIRPKQANANDTILICRDLRYTMPIYNSTPYHWWDSNLEAEYSIPYFETFFSQAENGKISVYEDPDLVDALKLSNVSKRREYTKNESIVKSLAENNISETDTTIKLKYNSDNIDYLRFGEEIYFDKTNCNFIKNCNYVAPVVRIFASDNSFIGYYPIYYVRKR